MKATRKPVASLASWAGGPVQHVIVSAAAAGLLLTSVVTQAQSADPPQSRKPDLELEEIIVTATKRRERVQDLPQAISVVTSERLEQLNARTFDDYFRSVPGLMLVTTEPSKRDYSLRGVGSGNITSNANTVDISTVSQYFDDIPVTSSGFQLNPRLVDIERVEVLRGPQGTLYGEGALGGMIRIVTRRPDLERLSGSIEGRVSTTQDGGVGNDTSLTLNLPLVENFAAARLNGFYAEDAGYIDAVYQDDVTDDIFGLYKEDYNSSLSKGFRGQLLIQPSDSISVLAQVIHSESRDNIGSYLPAVGDLLDRVQQCRERPNMPPPPPPPEDPNAPPPPPPEAPDPSTLPISDDCLGGRFLSRKVTTDLYNLTLEADFGWATLVSSSSYAKLDGTNELTDVNTVAGAMRRYAMAYQDQEAFVQELRLVSSKSWSERWDYVLGAFHQNRDDQYTFPPLQGNADFQPTYTMRPQTTETAVFVDGGYMLTDRLQARLGVRVSEVSTEGTVDIDDPTAEEDIPPQHPRSSFSPAPVTGRAVLTYFINPDMMTYTSVARGFRNGTLNNTLVNFGPSSLEPGFVPVPGTSDPDSVTTYELGWKLAFPSARAMVGGAVFRSDWKDMQLQSFRSIFPGAELPDNGSVPQDLFRPVFVNAARARIDGLELEASMELLTGLMGRVSFAYLDAALTEDFPMYDAEDRVILHGVKGDRIPFVARLSGSVGLSYRQPVFGTFDGFIDVNGQYQGERATDFNRLLNTSQQDGGSSPSPFTTYNLLEDYWTTSLQIGVQNAQWRAALTIDNVLNDRADVFHSADARVTTRPRTIGLFVRRNFQW